MRPPTDQIFIAVVMLLCAFVHGAAAFEMGFKRRALEGEYIIVSGGPALASWERFRADEHQHDIWWGNFVRAAKFRMQKLRARHGAELEITWLVYRTGYELRGEEENRDLISFVESVQRLENVQCNLVWFRTTRELIDYLNRGDKTFQRRDRKIVGFDYFGHSNKHCFTFGYGDQVMAASRVFLHESDLERIRRTVFAKSARCKSWGCHTGESMSRVWKKHFRIRLEGAIGKTDYSRLHEENIFEPHISTPGGRWAS